jgi:hypothetical protein
VGLFTSGNKLTARPLWPAGSARLTSRLSLFSDALENHHQEPLDALPDAGILRLPIAGDVETFDLWVSA